MQDEMRRLINLCEGLAESGDPIVSGKLNGRDIELDDAVVTLYDPDNSETDENNQPMVTYKVALDGEETEIDATYYAADQTWLVLRDGSDLEGGELMGNSLTQLLNQVPDFRHSEEDDGYGFDDHPSLTSAERNR